MAVRDAAGEAEGEKNVVERLKGSIIRSVASGIGD